MQVRVGDKERQVNGQELRMTDWESRFQSWAKPPGKTEQEKSERAIKAIRQAVADSIELVGEPVSVFTQGSYANRTTVRQDSDVDVCILCTKTFYYDLPAEITAEQVPIYPGTYSYKNYRNDVEQTLVDHFGASGLTRGNKAFDVNENTYRVDADAVACFEYRHYFKRPDVTQPCRSSNRKP